MTALLATMTALAACTSHTGPTAPNGSSASATFWDSTNIPAAKNVMMIRFLNRTNGKYPDSLVFWRVNINGVTTTKSIAQQQYFDMPANNSGRVYVFLGRVGTTSTDYYDFFEYDIGGSPPQFNGNTTRVDAFGIKLALRLHNANGDEETVGENPATFAEDRATTFQRFIAAVPSEFQSLAQQNAPYRILNPGAGGFDTGGAHANYYAAYIDSIWTENALTIPKAGPNGDGLGAYPDLSAAIYRHTAGPGTFNPNGTLISQSMWANPATFYLHAPADYYAKFWHDNAINGKAYGFPYDDVGGYSSYISHQNPQYMLVAIGW
ncbi:MAG TPA: beta-1,3-glucanase family protein [Gemmatimonadaceae bacterium]|nr:beta-1,3-glucanase family protein [Gemmatimonadaceae bacterium]